MVANRDVHELLHIITELSSVHEACSSVPRLKPSHGIPVIDKVVSSFYYAIGSMEMLSVKNQKLERVSSSMEKWAKKLEREYADEDVNSELPFFLENEDARELEELVDKWIYTITELFNDEGTALLKERAISEFFDKTTSIYLDEFAKADLEDGINSLLHLSPASAVLLMSRAFERMIKNFYKKTMGKEADYKTQDLNNMIKELEDNNKLSKSASSYLHRLRTIRNEITHENKRHSQEEAERMLLKIKDVIEEIDKTTL